MFQGIVTVFWIGVGCLLLLLGGVAIVGILLAFRKGIRTRGWPVAVGRVTSSAIVADDKGPTEKSPEARHIVARRAEIVYEYEVAGKRFTGDAVQVLEDHSLRRDEERVNRYPAGQSVLVYYDPDKPEDAVLEPGVPRSAAVGMAVGGGLLLIGLVITLAAAGALKSVFSEPLVIGLLFLVPGLGLVLLGLRNIRIDRASRYWPTTQGKVIDSHAVKCDDGFAPQVSYEYTVDGVAHVATNWGWRMITTRDRAEQLADEYPIGKPVTVYYDPMKPYRSMLEPGGQWMNYMVLLLGLGFAAAGVLLIMAAPGG